MVAFSPYHSHLIWALKDAILNVEYPRYYGMQHRAKSTQVSTMTGSCRCLMYEACNAGEFGGAATAVRNILKREGFRGLFAGYGSFLLRDLPFDAIEFVAYEQMKSMYKVSWLHFRQVEARHCCDYCCSGSPDKHFARFLKIAHHEFPKV